MPLVLTENRERARLANWSSFQRGTKMARNEAVKNCFGPCLHHSVIPPTKESLSFSAQLDFRMGMWPQMLPSEPFLGEQEGGFAPEPTDPFPHACYHSIWALLQKGNTSESVRCINLILGAPFKLLVAWKSLCSLVINETLCCSDLFPPLFSFCFSELSLSFAFVFLQ